MQRFKFYLSTSIVSFTALCMISCHKSITSKQLLIEYLNEPKHGLQITQEINKIKAGITFKPWELMAANLYKTKKSQDTSIINGIKGKYYFVFSLSANNKELLRQLPFSQYSEMVQVLAFRMRPFVSVVPDDGKAIEAEDCLFQQTYGMGKENELLLIFDKSKLQNATVLNIKIKEFGLNTGNLSFPINIIDIKNIPTISF